MLNSRRIISPSGQQVKAGNEYPSTESTLGADEVLKDGYAYPATSNNIN